MSKVLELYTVSTDIQTDWYDLTTRQLCSYLNRKCLKIRKSAPNVSIGTCTVTYGRESKPLIICPYRLLERRQVFVDCLHLLTLHEPGNELHLVQEVPVPGGSVDYFLVSVRSRQVKDFVGLELQTLDTTGTIWPERQRFLQEQGIEVSKDELSPTKSFGINWKMTAKTTLMQLHHKAQTFEHLNKHLVLAIQDHLLTYMRRAFRFEHLNQARLGDLIHIHPYTLSPAESKFHLSLGPRLSTSTDGIARCLGLQADARIELQEITRFLESKINDTTLLNDFIDFQE